MNHKIILTAAVVGLAAASAAQAQFSWSNVYGTLGVSYTDLRREAPASPLITRDSKNDAGFSFGLGYQAHPKVALEMGHYDLGTARVTDAGVGGPNYADQSVKALLASIKISPWEKQTFSPFVKLGNAHMKIREVGTSGPELSESRNRAYAALGVDYRVMDKIKLGLSYDHFWVNGSDAAIAGRPPRVNPRSLTLSTSVSF
jgi:opacity protein-like surface antigen